jgi:nucleoside-diphosphate-sugar epimerase
VYGPGDHPTRLVPVVLAAARTGGTVPLPARLSRRDWVWVGDVVDACVRAAADDALPPGVVLNIGTGVQTSTEELVAVAEWVTGRPIATAPGAHPGRHWDTADWVSDPTAAARLLGWRPTVDLAEGLARTWAAA